MALGRLELGEIETTSYDDPTLNCEIFIKFRHPTEGEIYGSFSAVGITLDAEAGTLVPAGGGLLDGITSREEANVVLAKMCILGANTDKALVEVEELYRPALVRIGAYLRSASGASEEEGKPSDPPASGPTSES